MEAIALIGSYLNELKGHLVEANTRRKQWNDARADKNEGICSVKYKR